MRPIDATRLVKLVLEERDKIPLETVERYSFGFPSPNKHGQSMRGGIRKALRLIEQAPTLDLAPKWISVKDKKPEDWAHVLVYIRHRHTPDDGYRDVLIKTYSERYGWNMGDNYYEITHWMPLPEPPKEG